MRKRFLCIVLAFITTISSNLPIILAGPMHTVLAATPEASVLTAQANLSNAGATLSSSDMPAPTYNGFIELPDTEELPVGAIPVSTEEELKSLGNSTEYFYLVNDIELTGEWEPINNFKGTLDGSGFSIKKLSINGKQSGGLFGVIYDGDVTIKNLAVDIDEINSTYYAGGIVGECRAGATLKISNCYTTGGIIEANEAGGIVGKMYAKGSITNCYSSCDITGGLNAGGIIGYGESPISYSYAEGAICATSNAGGIAGRISNSGVSYCFATGNVSGKVAGGLIGSFTINGSQDPSSDRVSDCYATGMVTAECPLGTASYSPAYGGGLIGSGSGVISNCYAKGDISVTSYGDYILHAGGLAGSWLKPWTGSYSGFHIEDCHATGSVNAVFNVQNARFYYACAGGLLGAAGSRDAFVLMKGCYASGNVEVVSSYTAYGGGLIGHADIEAEDCYAVGDVSIRNDFFTGTAPDLVVAAGGLFGTIFKDGSVANCYAEGDVATSSESTGFYYMRHVNYAGGLIGVCSGGVVSITDCTATGAVTAYDKSRNVSAGGLLGAFTNSFINSGDGSDKIKIEIIDSFALGNVVLQSAGHPSDAGIVLVSSAGGLVGGLYMYGQPDGGSGLLMGTASIIDSGASGNLSVSAVKNVAAGGLLGYIDGPLTLHNCGATGDISGVCTGDFMYAGGLLGGGRTYTLKEFDAFRCYATGDIDITLKGQSASFSDSYAGGLIGNFYTNEETIINECYAAGNVKLSIENMAYFVGVGGLIGHGITGDTLQVSNCHAVGSLTIDCPAIANTPSYDANLVMGGLIGYGCAAGSGSARIENCYAVCELVNPVKESSYIGGIIGYRTGTTASNVYYNMENAGYDGKYFTSLGAPKTTNEMMSMDTFVGFDFDTTWHMDAVINNGYPYLAELEDAYSINDEVGAIRISAPEEYNGFAVKLTAQDYENTRYLSNGSVVFNNLEKRLAYKAELLSQAGATLAVINDISLSQISGVTDVSFNISSATGSVALTVKQPNGTILTEGYTVNWRESEKGEIIATGATARGLPVGMVLNCEITLVGTLSVTYEQPLIRTIIVTNTEGGTNLSVVLTELSPCDVTGIVKEANGSPVKDAQVTMVSKLGLSSPYEYTVATKADGSFTAYAYTGNAKIFINKFGYANTSKSLVVEGNADVGEVIVEKASGLIVGLSMSYRASATGGSLDAVPLENTRNLVFSLYNTTKNTPITNFQLSGTSLVLNDDSIALNDTIQVKAVDSSGTMTDASASFQIQGSLDTVDLTFMQNGLWEARGCNSVNTENMALLYDGNGQYITTYYSSGDSFLGGVLPAGSYSVIFIGKSRLIRQLGQLSDYSLSGLSEGVDYTKSTFNITPGIITQLGSIHIPKLDEEKLYYTDSSKTALSLSRPDAAVGATIMVRIEYSFDENHSSDVDNFVVTAVLPNNCALEENSVTLNGESSSYTKPTTGTIAVAVGEPEGIIRFYVKPLAMGSYAINSFIAFDYINQPLSQPLGTAVLNVLPYQLNVPEEVGSTTVVVSGTAIPHSMVNVYNNGKPANIKTGSATAAPASIKANALGKWQAIIELDSSYSYSYHDIYAKILPETGPAAETELKELLYNSALADVSKINMICNGKVTTFDFLSPSLKVPSYSFNPSNPELTFTVEFTKDSGMSDVFVVTTDSDGVETRIKTIQNSAGLWVGTQAFTSYTLPVKVGAEFINSDKGTIVHNFEEISSFEQEIDDVLKVIGLSDDSFFGEVIADTDSYAEIAVYWKEHPELPMMRIALEFLDYGQYEGADLEEQGFVLATLENQEGNIGSFYLKTEETDEMSKSVYVIPEDKLVFSNTCTYIAFPETAVETFASFSSRAVNPYDHTAWNNFMNLIADLTPGVSGFKSGLERSSQIRRIEKYQSALGQFEWNLELILAAICRYDGLPRLDDAARLEFERRPLFGTGNFSAASYTYYEQMMQELKDYQVYVDFCFGTFMAASGTIIEDAAKGLGKRYAGKWIGTQLTKLGNFFANKKEKISNDVVSELITGAAGIGIQSGFIDKLLTLETRIDTEYDRYNKILNDFQTEVIASFKPCQSPEGDEDETQEANPRPGSSGVELSMKPIIDPSGYVYEAVASNRLEGVTTTAFYKEYPTSDEELWDAGDYGQENPLTTNAEGRYAWDVPFGDWKVKYEKSGYTIAYSDWLPVPPPQTDINIGMMSYDPPSVASAVGYEDYIELMFDKYMDVSTLLESIALTNYEGKYDISFIDEEQSPESPPKSYARIIRITPTERKFIVGESAGLKIEKSVKSYAGVNMLNDYQVSITIEAEPKSIYRPTILSLNYGESRDIDVTIIPTSAGKNKKIKAVSSSPLVASINSEAVTGEDSTARFTITGLISGAAEIQLMIEGTQIVNTINVNVELPGRTAVQKEKAAKPTATVPSGQVAPGTLLALSTNTAGAFIYYTTDGSCPCSEGTRKLYNDPIAITEDISISAAAYKDGMDYSSVLVLNYTVSGALTQCTVFVEAGQGGTVTGGGSFAAGTSVTVTAVPLKNYSFDGWYEGNTRIAGAGEVYTFTVLNNRTLQARFKYTGSTSGGTTSGGSNNTSDLQVTDNSSWQSTLNQIEMAKDGSTVTHNINGKFDLPLSVLNAIAGRDIILVLNMGGYLWSINGKSVTDFMDGATSYDMGVVEIADQGISTLSNGSEIVILELAHNGAFPFAAELTWNIGDSHADKRIYVCYYNGELNRLEFRSAVVADANGNITLLFERASKYVISDIITEGTYVKYNPETAILGVSSTNLMSYVPYLISDSKPEIISASALVDGCVVFTAPVDGIYEFRNNKKIFSDIAGHWATDTIDFISARELFSGIGNGKFDPDGQMTRAMFATVLSRLDKADLSSYGFSAFKDVDLDTWYGPSVAWAAENGIISGYGNGMFGPNNLITREQMTVLMYNYIKYKEIDLISDEHSTFKDTEKISMWAREAVLKMKSFGIIAGVGDNEFVPKSTASRASVAQLFMNFINAFTG